MGSTGRFVLLVLVVCALACATPVAPTGGDRDETPPVLQTEGTTPNESVDFDGRGFTLTYDEWLQLKDLNKELVISPPLEYRPEVSLRKKTVRFTFDEREVLRDSATYTVNFGDAVQDLNEGNSAEARFVFATGPFLDSLTVDAVVVDALTNAPVPKALFLLYESTRDSAALDELPFYFARTDKQGRATIRNVRAGRFRAAALLDNNQNYRLDGKEQIGFRAGPLLVSDTADAALVLRLFAEAPKQRIVQKETRDYGLVVLTFARPPDEVTLRYSPTPGLRTYPEVLKDSLRVWYTYAGNESWEIYYDRPDRIDTISVPARDVATLAGGQRLEIAEPVRNTVPVFDDAPARFVFSHPLQQLDPDSMYVLRDTLPEPLPIRAARIDSSALRTAVVEFGQAPGSVYLVHLLPGAATDIYGYSNRDTLRQRYRAVPADELSTLALEIAPLDSTQQYVLRFGRAKQPPTRTEVVRGRSSYTWDLGTLLPDNYQVEVIEDRNANGRWDTGNYLARRQPEPTQVIPLGTLRENWEQVEQLDVSFERAPPPVAPAPSPPAPRRPKN